MTTLDYRVARRTRHNLIFRSISGDLSRGYRVAPKNDYAGRNVGLAFGTLKGASLFSQRTGRLDWAGQVDAYRRTKNTGKSRYVGGKVARKLAQHPQAYGKVAERYRNMPKILR